MSYVEYDSNNSGGRWWLEDQHWAALEDAGWIVKWERLGYAYTAKGSNKRHKKLGGVPVLVALEELPESDLQRKLGRGDGRFLGAIATKAWKPNCTDLRAAAEEWERATGKSSTDAGCPCCGQPHTFTLYDDKGTYQKSGPSTSYDASWEDA